MTQPTQPPPSSGMEGLIEKAKEDLAQRLAIDVENINVLEARAVVWPDASLGCPQPGIVYAQVQTAGYLIQLEANSEIYEYHMDTGEQVILCENPEFPIIPVKPGEIDDGKPWMPN